MPYLSRSMILNRFSVSILSISTPAPEPPSCSEDMTRGRSCWFRVKLRHPQAGSRTSTNEHVTYFWRPRPTSRIRTLPCLSPFSRPKRCQLRVEQTITMAEQRGKSLTVPSSPHLPGKHATFRPRHQPRTRAARSSLATCRRTWGRMKLLYVYSILSASLFGATR